MVTKTTMEKNWSDCCDLVLSWLEVVWGSCETRGESFLLRQVFHTFRLTQFIFVVDLQSGLNGNRLAGFFKLSPRAKTRNVCGHGDVESRLLTVDWIEWLWWEEGGFPFEYWVNMNLLLSKLRTRPCRCPHGVIQFLGSHVPDVNFFCLPLDWADLRKNWKILGRDT